MRRLLLGTPAVLLNLVACAQPEPEDTSLGVRADATPRADTDSNRDASVRDWPMPNDAAPPRVDAVVPSRDAEIANDASADVGEPPPDASTEGGYCPEHLYVYNGDGYHGDNCYFDNFEGKSPSNCDVAYPGASPCFRCMVERCCLQAMCGGNEVYERLEATDGRRVFAAWSEFAMAIDRQIRFHNNALAPYTYNGAIACVAHCLDTRRPEQPGLPGPALLVECMQDCAEVFIPTCSFRPEWAEAWYEINGSIRRNVESL